MWPLKGPQINFGEKEIRAEGKNDMNFFHLRAYLQSFKGNGCQLGDDKHYNHLKLLLEYESL